MRHEALLLRDQVTSQGSGDGILARGLARGLAWGLRGAVHWQDWRLPAAAPCKAQGICKALRLWSLRTGLFGDCLLRAQGLVEGGARPPAIGSGNGSNSVCHYLVSLEHMLVCPCLSSRRQGGACAAAAHTEPAASAPAQQQDPAPGSSGSAVCARQQRPLSARTWQEVPQQTRHQQVRGWQAPVQPPTALIGAGAGRAQPACTACGCPPFQHTKRHAPCVDTPQLLPLRMLGWSLNLCLR